MRLVALCVSVLCLTSCSDVLSIQSLAGKAETSFDAGLVGTWFDRDDTVITVKGGESSNYEILVLNAKNGDKLHLQGRLIRLGDQSILEVADSNTHSLFEISGHAWLSVSKKGDGLQIRFLDSKWFRQQVRQSGLPFFEVNDHPVLTASTDQLQKFVKQFGTRPEALSDPMNLVRFNRPD